MDGSHRTSASSRGLRSTCTSAAGMRALLIMIMTSTSRSASTIWSRSIERARAHFVFSPPFFPFLFKAAGRRAQHSLARSQRDEHTHLCSKKNDRRVWKAGKLDVWGKRKVARARSVTDGKKLRGVDWWRMGRTVGRESEREGGAGKARGVSGEGGPQWRGHPAPNPCCAGVPRAACRRGAWRRSRRDPSDAAGVTRSARPCRARP